MDLLNGGNIWVRPHKDYHGTGYCKQVIADVLVAMNWGTQKYLGSLDRIANEVFNVNLSEGINYRIEFAINTYEKKVARLECMITGLKTENYDQKRFWGQTQCG